MPGRGEDGRGRRTGIVLVAVIAVLFAAQLVALAAGLLEVSAAILAIFIVGWFVLRSHQRRADR